METLTLRELLEKAHTILVDTKNEHLAAAVQHRQASPTPCLRETGQSGLNCFRCGGPNHLTRDCTQHSHVRNRREKSAMHCYLCNKTGHLVKNCLENRSRGGDISATLSPNKLKEVLSVIEAVVDGKKYWWILDVLSPSWLDLCAIPWANRHWTSSMVMVSVLSHWQ